MPGSRVAIRTVSTFYESNQGGDRAELMSPFGHKADMPITVSSKQPPI